VFGLQTHCTATSVPTRRGADHSLAGYTHIGRHALEGAHCCPRNLAERAADRSTSKREQQQRRLSAGRRQLRRSAASKRLLRNSSLYPSNRLARPVANVRARQVADLTVCEHSPASRDRTPSQSRSTIDRIWSLAGRNRARSLLPNRPSQAMNTEKTNGESTPPAITSFSPVRSGASSPRK